MAGVPSLSINGWNLTCNISTNGPCGSISRFCCKQSRPCSRARAPSNLAELLISGAHDRDRAPLSSVSERMQQSNHLRLVSSDHPPRRSLPFLQVNNPNYGSALRGEVVSDFASWRRFLRIGSACGKAMAGGRFSRLSPGPEPGGTPTVMTSHFAPRSSLTGQQGYRHSSAGEARQCRPVSRDAGSRLHRSAVRGRAGKRSSHALRCRALFQSVEHWDECILQHLAKDGRVRAPCHELPRDLRRRMKLVPAGRYQTILSRGKPRGDLQLAAREAPYPAAQQ